MKRNKGICLERARPVIEYLVGTYADEAMAYISENHGGLFTGREIKVRFLQWFFRAQPFHIHSFKWRIAWERLDGLERG